MTLRLREQMELEGPTIVGKLLAKALTGDMQALRLCLSRMYPIQRERAVFLELPKIHTAHDATDAISVVSDAIGDGRITPQEGQTLVGIIEAQQRAMACRDQDGRQPKPEAPAHDPREGDV